MAMHAALHDFAVVIELGLKLSFEAGVIIRRGEANRARLLAAADMKRIRLWEVAARRELPSFEGIAAP